MKIFNYDDLGDKRSWEFSVANPPEKYGIRPICETDKKVDIGDMLIIGDNAYSISGLQGANDGGYVHCYVTKLSNREVLLFGKQPEQQYCTDEITCPYCGEEQGDSWEMDSYESEYVCESCGGVYSYEREVEVTYTSTPVRMNTERHIRIK